MNNTETKRRFLGRVFDPTPRQWQQIRASVLQMERATFVDGAFDDAYLRNEFLDPENVGVLLIERITGRLAGFTLAGPLYRFDSRRQRDTDTAYISEHRHR